VSSSIGIRIDGAGIEVGILAVSRGKTMLSSRMAGDLLMVEMKLGSLHVQDYATGPLR
jgi:hypothetical protein